MHIRLHHANRISLRPTAARLHRLHGLGFRSFRLSFLFDHFFDISSFRSENLVVLSISSTANMLDRFFKIVIEVLECPAASAFLKAHFNHTLQMLLVNDNVWPVSTTAGRVVQEVAK